MRLNSALLGLLGLALAAGAAHATVDFSRMTGRDCATCHQDNQTPTKQTVTPVGLGFADCRLEQSCINQWKASLPPETRPGGFNAPPPVAHTTANYDGVARFENRCPSGQARWVNLRPGKDSAKRDVVLILEPGQHILVGVSQGTVWGAGCGDTMKTPSSFSYVTLDKWANP